jgi:hypothetical protein
LDAQVGIGIGTREHLLLADAAIVNGRRVRVALTPRRAPVTRLPMAVLSLPRLLGK